MKLTINGIEVNTSDAREAKALIDLYAKQEAKPVEKVKRTKYHRWTSEEVLTVYKNPSMSAGSLAKMLPNVRTSAIRNLQYNIKRSLAGDTKYLSQSIRSVLKPYITRVTTSTIPVAIKVV